VVSSCVASAMPRARELREPATVRHHMACLSLGRDSHLVFELRVGPALLAGVVDACMLNVVPLSLAGRVIHQRDQPQPRAAHEGFEQLACIRCRQFATHVDEVICAQHAGRLHAVEHGEQCALVA